MTTSEYSWTTWGVPPDTWLGWVWDKPVVSLSAGPAFSRAGEDEPPPVKHPCGFAPPAKPEQEPELWEGDQA